MGFERDLMENSTILAYIYWNKSTWYGECLRKYGIYMYLHSVLAIFTAFKWWEHIKFVCSSNLVLCAMSCVLCVCLFQILHITTHSYFFKVALGLSFFTTEIHSRGSCDIPSSAKEPPRRPPRYSWDLKCTSLSRGRENRGQEILAVFVLIVFFWTACWDVGRRGQLSF